MCCNLFENVLFIARFVPHYILNEKKHTLTSRKKVTGMFSFVDYTLCVFIEPCRNSLSCTDAQIKTAELVANPKFPSLSIAVAPPRPLMRLFILFTALSAAD